MATLTRRPWLWVYVCLQLQLLHFGSVKSWALSRAPTSARRARRAGLATMTVPQQPFSEGSNPDSVTATPELQNFLDKKVSRKWAGNAEILKRRGQVPSAAFSPRKVVFTVFAALKNNDEPQIDHGALVLLTFSSPTGDLGMSNLDPSEMATFIRETWPEVIDFKSAELVGDEPRTICSGRVVQTVVVSTYNEQKAAFDIYLRLHDGEETLWLIDVVLRQ